MVMILHGRKRWKIDSVIIHLVQKKVVQAVSMQQEITVC